jgi:hypothetical protein
VDEKNRTHAFSQNGERTIHGIYAKGEKTQ